MLLLLPAAAAASAAVPASSIRVPSRNAAAAAATSATATATIATTPTSTAAVAVAVAAVAADSTAASSPAGTFLTKSQESRKAQEAETRPHVYPFPLTYSKYGSTPYVVIGNRPMSHWWQFYHVYKDHSLVSSLDPDKVFACCNMCGKT
jgi:hypothetical protein